MRKIILIYVLIFLFPHLLPFPEVVAQNPDASPTTNQTGPSVTLTFPSRKPTADISQYQTKAVQLLEISEKIMRQMESVQVKTQNAITKIKSRRTVPAELETALNSMNIKHQQLVSTIDNSRQTFNSLNNTADPKTVKNRIKITLTAIRKALKDYQQSIIQVITVMKKIMKSPNPSNTAIPSTTITTPGPHISITNIPTISPSLTPVP